MLNEIKSTLKQLQLPCREVCASDMKERMDLVEEAHSNLVKKVNDNRKYMTSKYHELKMERTNEKLEVANSRFHELKRSYGDLAETIGKGKKKTGTT